MKTMFVLIGASTGALLANPILAKDPPAKIDVAASAGPETAVARKTRYCSEFYVTGSLIKRKVCRTRDEWLADGVDPVGK